MVEEFKVVGSTDGRITVSRRYFKVAK